MSVVYLGFLETLQTILGKIFETVLTEVLVPLLSVLFRLAGVLLSKVLSILFFRLLLIVLNILDFLSGIFDIFSGVRYVNYTAPGATVPQKSYLLDLFVNYPPVTQVFIGISLLAAGVSLLFTIYAVSKSMSDMTLEGENPVGKVMGRALKAAGAFLMIPLMVAVLLQLSNIVVFEVNDIIMRGGYLGEGQPPTVGTIIFLTGSLNAGKTEVKNGPSFTDELRISYYNGTKKFYDADQVEKDFDIEKYDMLTAIICGALIVIIMVLGILLFVRRIVEVLLLYLVSPLFVSAIPLDDGGVFTRWQELFVAKVFSGFGTVFSMKLFLVVIPLISGPGITLYPDPTVDAILRVFIMIGGAWATFMAQHLILQILNPEAAMAAQATFAMMAGAVIGLVTGASGLAQSMVRGSAGGKKSGKSKEKKGGGASSMTRQQVYGPEKPAQQNQAFRGK